MKLSKQHEILQFIQNKLENEGYSPSIREIAEEVNLKSTSSVQYHLNKRQIRQFFEQVHVVQSVFLNVDFECNFQIIH